MRTLDLRSLADRTLLSIAYRAVWKLSARDAAAVVEDLVVNGPVLAQLSDRQIAHVALALARHPFIVGRAVARTPIEGIASTAAEQFALRDALVHLSDSDAAKMAEALGAHPAFVDATLGHVEGADAAKIVAQHFHRRQLFALLSPEDANQIAVDFAQWPTATRSILAAQPDADAARLAIEQIAGRQLLAHVSPDHGRAFIDSLMRNNAQRWITPEDQAKWAHAILSQLEPDQAADVVARDGALSNALTATAALQGAFIKNASALPAKAVAQLVEGIGAERTAEALVKNASAISARTISALVKEIGVERTAEALRSDAALSISLATTDAIQDSLVQNPDALSVPAARRLAGALARSNISIATGALKEASPEFEHRAESYSQEGEDLILARMFDADYKGFFVDVGALHPIRFSNTYLLYKRGWRGLNIEATPGAMAAFEKLRDGDTNIEAFVSDEPIEHNFYLFNEPALNTFSEALAKQRSSENPKYRVVSTVKVKAQRLDEILQKHAPSRQAIDLLTIDVEGADLNVLRSNDWARYRPRIVLVEMLTTSLGELGQQELTQYLAAQNYEPIAKLYNSVFFRDTTAAC